MMTPNTADRPRWSLWILLALRLLLGAAFIYIGLQKLIDPQFFDPTTPGYIGKQLVIATSGSPMHDFLMSTVVPQATLFGLLIVFGMIIIGLATLLGVFMRVVAFCGMLLSIIFFISISWKVAPSFYAWHLLLAFGWLAIVLNGPCYTGMPTVDEAIGRNLVKDTLRSRKRHQAAHMLLGTTSLLAASTTLGSFNAANARPFGPGRVNAGGAQFPAAGSAAKDSKAVEERRRKFILMGLAGGASIFGLAAFSFIMQLFGGEDPTTQIVHTQTPTPSNNTPIATDTPVSTPTPNTTPTPNAVTPANRTVKNTANPTMVDNNLANSVSYVTVLPLNTAATFSIPVSGKPGILVHLDNDQYAAFDATCPHAGCAVNYDPGAKMLVCPCHGSQFDATHGQVLKAPAQAPLKSLALKINADTGEITLA